MTNFNRRSALGLLGGTLAAGSLATPALASNRKIKVGALRFTSHLSVVRVFGTNGGLT